MASDRRAGAWSGSRALRMRYDFMRRAWGVVITWPLLACVVAPVVLLAPGWMRGYALGAIAASGLWGAAYVVATMSGASSAQLGQLAEQWSASELRRLRRRGWYLINQVHFRSWDIDHVLLGPGGALVVETKFSSDGWAASRYTDRVLADAQARVLGNAQDIRLSLGKSLLPPSLVTPVIVLWGPNDLTAIDRQNNGVVVLSGHLLRTWLAGITDVGLDHGTVAQLYDKLSCQVEKRDRQDLQREGTQPKPLSSSVILLCGAAALGLSACWAELESLHLVGYRWFLPMGTAFATAQLPFRRLTSSRPWRLAWLAGSQAATGLIGLVYIAAVGRHIL